MAKKQRLLLSGNEAVALGAWQAGCRLGAGYPGTPSSEILPSLLKWAEELGGEVYAEWSVNEKVAVEVASGAAMAGARAVATMKHVGLNVAADPFFTLAYTGVEAGLVVIVADDPDMHSSQNEQDSRIYGRHAGVPVLEPADSQEAYEFTRLAFELSEGFDLPILLRLTTRVSHSRSVVQTTGEREERLPEGAPVNPDKYTMVPANARVRHASQLERLERVCEWADHEAKVNMVRFGRGRTGFVTAGVAYEYLAEIRPDAPMLKLGMSWPLPVQTLTYFALGLERMVVVEELEPFLHEQVSALGLLAESLPPAYRLGELSPGRLAQALQKMDITTGYEGSAEKSGEEELPARPPVLCPGCPHRAVFFALNRLKALVTGDIGCYTLGTLEPLRALHTCLCMGAGINQAHGVAKATQGAQKVVAVIGDSTFTHMGMPGLLNAVYNAGDFVTVILDNRTTAMTGGQDHPGTGRNLKGEEAPALDFVRLAEAMGAGLVLKLGTEDLGALEAGLRRALEHEGPAAVVVESPCVLQYRGREEPYEIDEEACVGCGLCLRVGCPALTAEEREGKLWPKLEAALCTGCGLCAQVCPREAISRASRAD